MGGWLRNRMCRLAAMALGLPLLGAPGLAMAAPGQCELGIMADLKVTMNGLRPMAAARINGRDTSFLLDSGAFYSLMPRVKAEAFGLRLDPTATGLRVIGIGGSTTPMVTSIKQFEISGHVLHNIAFLVGGSDTGEGLIGRNLLALEDTEFDLAHGSVKLIAPKHCDGVMAYWGKPGQTCFVTDLLTDDQRGIGEHQFRLSVLLNGVKVSAEIDSGASTSLVSRRAVEKAGIDLSEPGVDRNISLMGLGSRSVNGFVAHVASIEIGNEKVLRSRLRVIDGSISAAVGAPDMLLGADWLLAHHVYVARAQRKIYFTYTGGRPFIAPGQDGPAPPATPLPAGTVRVAAADDVEPKSAEEFANRAAARAVSGNRQGALDDYDRAVALAPSSAVYRLRRAEAYERTGRGRLAAADLDAAIGLDPRAVAPRLARAGLRLRSGDRAGALADTEAAAASANAGSLETAEAASLLMDLRQPARAIALLDRVIALHKEDPRLGALYNSRCWARALANEALAEAAADCDRAIRRDGALPAYLDSRALVRLRRGDAAGALADTKAALSANPRIAWSLWTQAAAEAALGKADAASADRAAALALRPDLAEEAKAYGLPGA